MGSENVQHDGRRRSSAARPADDPQVGLDFEGTAPKPPKVYRGELGLGSVMAQIDNMGHANSHVPWEDALPTDLAAGEVWGGIDWLSITFWLGYRDWLAVRERLEEARTRAEKVGEPVVVELGQHLGRVEAYGSGKGFSHARYVVQVDGIRFAIVDAPGEGDRPSMFVEITGEPMLHHGFRGALEIVNEVLAGMGAGVKRTSVSRADLYVDVPDVPVSAFVNAFLEGRCIRQATKFSLYGEGAAANIQTLTLGAGGASCRLRFYDKLAELSKSDHKQERQIERWGGRIPDSVTRVEFQLRGQKLQELEASDLATFLGSLGRLTNYLTWRWFRLSESEVDRTHTTRYGGSETWRSVRGRFAAVFAMFGTARLARPKTQVDPGRMLAQAKGCIARVFADLGEVPTGVGEVVDLFGAAVAERYEAFVQSVLDKGAGRVGGAHMMAEVTVERGRVRLLDRSLRAVGVNWLLDSAKQREAAAERMPILTP